MRLTTMSFALLRVPPVIPILGISGSDQATIISGDDQRGGARAGFAVDVWPVAVGRIPWIDALVPGMPMAIVIGAMVMILAAIEVIILRKRGAREQAADRDGNAALDDIATAITPLDDVYIFCASAPVFEVARVAADVPSQRAGRDKALISDMINAAA